MIERLLRDNNQNILPRQLLAPAAVLLSAVAFAGCASDHDGNTHARSAHPDVLAQSSLASGDVRSITDAQASGIAILEATTQKADDPVPWQEAPEPEPQHSKHVSQPSVKKASKSVPEQVSRPVDNTIVASVITTSVTESAPKQKQETTVDTIAVSAPAPAPAAEAAPAAPAPPPAPEPAPAPAVAVAQTPETAPPVPTAAPEAVPVATPVAAAAPTQAPAPAAAAPESSSPPPAPTPAPAAEAAPAPAPPPAPEPAPAPEAAPAPAPEPTPTPPAAAPAPEAAPAPADEDDGNENDVIIPSDNRPSDIPDDLYGDD